MAVSQICICSFIRQTPDFLIISDNYNHMLFPGYYTNNMLHSYLLRQSVTAKRKKIQLKNVLYHFTYKRINTQFDYGKVRCVHRSCKVFDLCLWTSPIYTAWFIITYNWNNLIVSSLKYELKSILVEGHPRNLSSEEDRNS